MREGTVPDIMLYIRVKRIIIIFRCSIETVDARGYAGSHRVERVKRALSKQTKTPRRRRRVFRRECGSCRRCCAIRQLYYNITIIHPPRVNGTRKLSVMPTTISPTNCTRWRRSRSNGNAFDEENVFCSNPGE